MLEKIKQVIRQYRCEHNMNVVRWHWVHFPNYEPISVEIEYKCKICGKIDYLHLRGREATEWETAMGDYKKYY